MTTIAETVVPRVGIEPTLLAERDFESPGGMRQALAFRAITSPDCSAEPPMSGLRCASGLAHPFNGEMTNYGVSLSCRVPCDLAVEPAVRRVSNDSRRPC